MSEGGGRKREGRQQWRQRRQRPPTRSVTPELAPREEEDRVDEIAAAAAAGAAAPSATTATTAASDRSPSCSNTSSAALAAAAASTRQLFGIFRPVSQIKRLHIVRHGQSTYNEAVEARGSAFADPRHIFDAPLTGLGRRQAGGELRRELSRLDLKVSDTLWVVSPLTRALETFALGCPFLEGGSGLVGGGGGGASSGAAASPSPPPSRALAVVVRPEVSERLCTSGDVGLPASRLREQWPGLASLGALDALPELWWHGARGGANCAERRRFSLPERASELEARVAAFRRWLHSRPERSVVVVGHSVCFRSLQRSCSAAGGGRVGGGGGGAVGPRRGSGGKGGGGGGAGATTLRNCEVATLYF